MKTKLTDKEKLIYNHLRAAMEKGITVYYKTRKGKLVGVDSTHAIMKLDGVETTVRAKHKYVSVYAEIDYI